MQIERSCGRRRNMKNPLGELGDPNGPITSSRPYCAIGESTLNCR
jgi:hypothetical protein